MTESYCSLILMLLRAYQSLTYNHSMAYSTNTGISINIPIYAMHLLASFDSIQEYSVVIHVDTGEYQQDSKSNQC